MCSPTTFCRNPPLACAAATLAVRLGGVRISLPRVARSGSLVLLGVVCLLALPCKALGFAAISTTGPSTVILGTPQVLPFRVTFTSSGFSEKFQATVFVNGDRGGTAAIRLARTPQVIGPGTIEASGGGQPFISLGGGARCPTDGGGSRGYRPTSTSVEIDLAPFSAITLEYQVRTGEFPLHTGQSLSPQMSFPSALIQDGDSLPPRFVDFPAPAPVGPIGVTFSLRTKPVRHFRAGSPIRIFGRTTPPLIKRRVGVIALYPGGGMRTVLGRPRTDRKGRFRLDGWRPPKHGTYYLGVRYRATEGSRQSDFLPCMKQIEVGARKVAARPR